MDGSFEAVKGKLMVFKHGVVMTFVNERLGNSGRGASQD